MQERTDELWYYDIYPKVVPVGEPVTITVRALSEHVAFAPDMEVRIQPVNIPGGSNSYEGELCPADVTSQKFCFTWTFSTEQEYHVRFPARSGDSPVRLRVYALEKDLMALRPLIGDFHGHTTGSDGKEAPAFMAARYCEEGYDFVTITDHLRYASSVEARDIYKDLSMNFHIYPGEECHPQDNPVHIVNFGSDAPVNEEYLYTENMAPRGFAKAEYRTDWKDRVRQIQDALPPLPEGIDPFIHASCLLICQLIREKGGLAILCHPHWMHGMSRNVPDCFTRYWVEHNLADAYEVVSGQSLRENVTQLALYQQLQSEGNRIPAVCSSDSHGTCNDSYCAPPDTYSLFTAERTMVFAADNDKNAIIDAVKDLRTVLLEQYKGEGCHVHGPYRLVAYALFLLREYYPLRDYLCKEQGQLMMRYSTGEPDTAEDILAVDRKLERIRRKYFWQKNA